MALSITTFEQFVRYVNDLAGLERLFRLLQSAVQIAISYPSTIHLVDPLILLITRVQPSVTLRRTTLLVLQQRIDLARRYLRVLRFLDTFQQTQRLFHQNFVTSPQPPGTVTTASNPAPASEESSSGTPSPPPQRWPRAEEWLDLLGRTFNGMHLLVETSTIVDYMQVEGLHIWGPGGKVAVNAEAQRFWLFTLVCSVLAGLVRIGRLLAAGDEPLRGITKTTTGDGAGDPAEKGNSRGAGEKEAEERRRKKSDTLRRLVRSVMTNSIDIVLPAVVVGWLHVGPGVVALAMFVTTLSTSVDVWERCGRGIASQK
ncbi:hypothetical protein F5X97DRAFT_307292 [Nemania serpens]|nr:hypothetical protein F5X97DRAFT_307292 [Nemania serpens]